VSRGYGNISIVSSIRSGIDVSSRLVSKSIERLSSGQRINRAADDPAALAVSMSLATRTGVLNRGRLNVADGVSALNIADSTLELVGSTLERMLELAEGAANGGLSTAQRRTMAAEYQALDREIRRLTGSTSFNGIKLLEGTSSHRVTAESTIAAGASTVTTEAFSGDGRYFTYRDATTSTLRQIDRTTGVTTTLASGVAARAPVSSASGGVVVYQSGNNLFRWDRASGTTTQLTNAQGAETYAGLSISADGGSVAFSAVTQYQHGSAPSAATSTGSQRIYQLSFETGRISTVGTTAVTGAFTSFQLSSDGASLVFTSQNNLVGGNADLSREVYLASFDAATPTYTQVSQTTSGGDIAFAAIAGRDQVFLISDQNVGGVNTTGSGNIIRYNPTTGSYERLTNNTSVNGPQSLTVSTDGALISFSSFADLTGENSGSQLAQIFQLDTITGTLRQSSRFNNPLSQLTAVGAFSRDGGSVFMGVGDLDALPTNYSFGELAPTARSLVVNAGSGREGAIGVTIADLMGSLRGAGGLAISAQSGAREAIDPLRRSIAALSSIRSTVGAGMSRLDVANRLLSAQGVEYTSARAAITDANVADEMATLTRGRILQQVGASLLTSARLQPEIALSLLRF